MDLLLERVPLYTLSLKLCLGFIIKIIWITAFWAINSINIIFSPFVIDASTFKLCYLRITVIFDSVLVWLSSMETSSCSLILLRSFPCWAAAMRLFSMAATLSGLTSFIFVTTLHLWVTSVASFGSQNLGQDWLLIFLLLSTLRLLYTAAWLISRAASHSFRLVAFQK